MKINPAAVLALLKFLSLSGCHESHSAFDVVGTYVGTYGGGTETFDVRADGKFTQVARVNGQITYENEGQWEWSAETSIIKFIPFAKCIDEDTGQPNLSKQPSILDYDTADWTSERGQLLFDIENGYSAIRDH